MEMHTTDYLKKALMDSQEHIRDYMHLSESIKDEEISELFRRQAEVTGEFASQLNSILSNR